MDTRIREALERLEAALGRLEDKAAATPAATTPAMPSAEQREEITAIRGMIGEAVALIDGVSSPMAHETEARDE